VLPSLPKIDAVLAQGGSDDFGIARAFEQFGGDYAKSMPLIEGGGSTDFIKWWAEQKKKNGYETISMNTTPGIGGAAFYLALELVKGAEADKKLIMPVATVTQADVDEYAKMPSGMIVSPTYTQEWVQKNLLGK
jgi:ribose transport system substrate-binding protein